MKEGDRGDSKVMCSEKRREEMEGDERKKKDKEGEEDGGRERGKYIDNGKRKEG